MKLMDGLAGGRRRTRWVLAAALGGVGLMPAAALAQDAPTAERTVVNPSVLEQQRPARLSLPPGDQAVRKTPGKEALLTLNIDYTDPDKTRIFNPATNSYDKVKLRTYNRQLVAPTIRVNPGETARITLINSLEKEDCATPADGINTPHCFNSTNLHAHGLWVSPAGNSDNVLVTIAPKTRFQYEYNVPADHPAGTYWYHPHLHGATALQVASGMGGALIVDGDRPPTPGGWGDIDTILKTADGKAFRERVVLLQQIQYACRNPDGTIKTRTVDGKTVAWVCDPGDVGTIEGKNGSDQGYDQFGPASWQESNRYTTLNGAVQPTFVDARAGEIERWRVIHAGVRDTINLAIVKAKPGAKPITPGMGPAQTLWMQENCSGNARDTDTDPALVQWQFASDGQTQERVIPLRTNTFQPGYRSDFLAVFPESGLYCVVDRGANQDGTVNGQVKSDRLLAFVRVTGIKRVRDNGLKTITDTLTAAAGRLPRDVRTQVRQDLKNGLHLNKFVAHAPVTDGEVSGKQNLTFAISNATGKFTFLVDGKPFDPTDFTRTVTLGTAEEWTLTAANEITPATTPPTVISHPFHIHVNPFQIVRILNKDGTDVTDPAIPRARRLALEGGDPQYLDLKGVWKDTVWVKQDYKVVIRTRYERYIGDFVLHCHILDHEDQGMMQMVRIAVPGGSAHEAHATHAAAGHAGHGSNP